jgi:hypothetical protein
MSNWLIHDPVEIDVECKERVFPSVDYNGKPCDLEFGHEGPHRHGDQESLLYAGHEIGKTDFDLGSITAHSGGGGSGLSEGDLVFNDEGKPLGHWHGGRVIGLSPPMTPSVSGGMLSVGSYITTDTAAIWDDKTVSHVHVEPPRLFNPDEKTENTTEVVDHSIKFV